MLTGQNYIEKYPPNPSTRKSCRSLPFNILGEAEKMVHNLVSSGVIRECTKPTQFFASSNFVRKPSARGLRLITDLRPLNAHTERVGWLFFSSSDLQKISSLTQKYSGLSIFVRILSDTPLGKIQRIDRIPHAVGKILLQKTPTRI